MQLTESPNPEGRSISPTLTNLVLLAGLAAMAGLIRLAVLTGRTDDAANDARWAELTDTPLAEKPARTSQLAGLAAAAGRMTRFVSSGILSQRSRRPVPVEPPVWPAREF